jgi:hypothetical protein
MYCPKITYYFSVEEIKALDKRIQEIARTYYEGDTGWFNVGEYEHLTFIDDNDNMYSIHLRGRFWRKDESQYDLEYVSLEKDGVIFNFDPNLFTNHW